MLCRLTRWLISRAEDRGKALPRFAQRHAERCADCREYARFTAALSSRFSQEIRPFLAAIPDFPLNPAGPVSESPRPGKGGLRGRRFAFLPFPAAALAVAATALILFLVVPRTASLSLRDREQAAATLKTVTAAPAQFRGILEGAETSLTNERAILEKSFLSAIDYLQARLNIKIERREDLNPL